jgi:hypothetical protein
MGEYNEIGKVRSLISKLAADSVCPHRVMTGWSQYSTVTAHPREISYFILVFNFIMHSMNTLLEDFSSSSSSTFRLSIAHGCHHRESDAA